MRSTLKNSGIFNDLTDEELDAIANLMRTRVIPSGQEIVHEGGDASSLFVLEAGTVDIHKREESGSPAQLAALSPGAIFGELAFFSEQQSCAGVMAHGPVTVLELPYGSLVDLAQRRPELGVKLYRAMAASMCDKLRKTNSNLINLISSSRLVALGQMAAGIAHEITTPLATIQLLAEQAEHQLLEDPSDKDSILKNLDGIKTTVSHISSVIKGIAAVSRASHKDAMVTANLATVMNRTLDFCKNKFRAQGIHLDVSTIPPGLDFFGNSGQISQVILNLLNNAYDAVHSLPDRWVKVSAADLGEQIEVSITDSGAGILSAIQGQIFLPFFTTKETGKGTGLGLNISRDIIEAHNGTLVFDQGYLNTRFLFRLPKRESRLEMTSVNSVKSQKRTLIVDDDYYFRTALAKCLEQNGYEAICAESPDHAKQLIGLDDFSLVISDINMPGTSGIELLAWVKKVAHLPVILMTGFNGLEETNSAHDAGADGFLAKPFKKEDLLLLIEKYLSTEVAKATAAEEMVNLDDEYCKISIDDFISGSDIKYDIFIRLSEFKYVKIAHSGQDITVDRIKSYKTKNIHFLYMSKESFRKYVDVNMSLTKLVHSSTSIEHARKVNFLRHTSEVVCNVLFNSEINEETLSHAKNIVDMSVSLMSDNQDAVNLLTSLSGHSDHVHAHSVGVSLYSAMLGRQLGWKSPLISFKLSLAGLFHDIGKKEIPREILDKQRKDLSADEVRIYESHPVRGAEILASTPGISSDIVQIVHQHHENCVGFGYPSGLKKSKIHPLARVIYVASEFCKLTLKGSSHPGMSPKEAIQKMTTFNVEYYDEEVMLALKILFKLIDPNAAFNTKKVTAKGSN